MGHRNTGSKSSNRSLKSYIRPRVLIQTENTVLFRLHRPGELAPVLGIWPGLKLWNSSYFSGEDSRASNKAGAFLL